MFYAQSVNFLRFVVSKRCSSLIMGPAKTQAITEWPRPTSLHSVQNFLGFFHRFLQNFSTMVAPLTVLTKKATGHFQWTPEAQKTFEELKRRLISALFLRLPDPALSLVVEVDTSDVYVGAVVSQHMEDKHKLYPCASHTHCLTPAERNYDVWDYELLVVKLALEE